ncbi:MAG: alpha/beta hydrolase [Clostridiales bacterium]|nr:alpha/beta hydrolase [Clostridiales bacterium]
MRSFMSSFASFAIKMSGYKKKVADPKRRKKYIEKLAKNNDKPVSLPPFAYKTKPAKEIIYGVETFVFGEGKSKKIIYLHGGAFCEQPLLPHFIFCDKICSKTDYSVLMPVYKKSPKHTYEETYSFLESLYKDILKNTLREDIVFMGDSSGGGLALAFCEYLSELSLPQPKEMILISPWLDISMDTPFPEEFSRLDPSLQYDFLKEVGKNWAGETDVHDYRLSPIYGNLKGIAPITVYYGTYEALVVDARRFKKICQQSDVPLVYREFEKMNHCFPIYPIPEATTVQKEIVAVLNRE